MIRVCLLALVAMAARAENWPSFRGGSARGVAESEKLPVKWSTSTGENIAWKTEIPGLGHSSPVIWGDRIFLTTAVSANRNMVFERELKGPIDRRQDRARQEFRVLGIDKKSGRIVWNELAAAAEPRVLRHPHNSYASPTPATDGKRLVASFGSEGLFCYTLDGKLAWKKDLGVIDQGAFDVPDYQWGTAASPILWRDTVFLQIDMHRGSFLAAFDAKTGKELWRTPRDSKPSWSTPTVVEGPLRNELVANGVEHVCGYDPKTGKELWRLKGTSMISVPTPFTAHGLIYVFSGYFRNIRRSYAIRPGATGDITGSKQWIAWMTEEAPYLSTPVIAGDYLYTLSTRGVLAGINAKTGETLFQQRLGLGTAFSASLVAAGGVVYGVNELGEFYIFRAGPKYDEAARVEMGETVMATPAVSDSTLFVRGAKHLYAIRGK
ncbi:MAG: PQQ-binding-like beta-propeller repeat protein [Acidobacteria bacterium]|nr:PQQ-binding-like beta-propeller repeat protein [Acidobacteriota bacterium]